MSNACSLLIPCFNAAFCLPRLWECVDSQSAPFAEVLCYDDGSSDNTVEIARKLGAKVFQAEKNRGPAFARNQLLREASYPWVHFHDADDLMHAEYLRSCSEFFGEDCDVVFCNTDWLLEDSREVEIQWRYDQTKIDLDPISEFIRNPVGGINGTFRKSLLAQIGGYNEAYRCWEDADLYVRLAKQGARFKLLEEVLVTALRTPGSVSNDPGLCWQSRLQILKDYSLWIEPKNRKVLCEAFELAASQLLSCGAIRSSKEAISCCKQLGGDPPQTKSRFLQGLKTVLPAYAVFLLQDGLRKFHAGRS